MNTNKKLNMTMLCDFYELTMGNGYFKAGYKDRITHFDLFFRNVPDKGGYAIAAGLEQVIEYIQDLHFDPEDIEYLRSRNMFDEGFLDYLANFKFTGDIFAVPEGTPVFPKEPILTVRAPAIQAGDLPAADHQPPEPDRDQVQPHRPGRQRPNRAGVRLPPGPGVQRRHRRRPRGLHRRLQGHGLHHLRPALRRARRGDHGPRLGADLPQPVRGL